MQQTAFERKLESIMNRHSLTYDHADADLKDKILEAINDFDRKLEKIADTVYETACD